ncbi:MAG TPA: MFS transporter [Gaiellales bacterium]|nr:MFS transporter [Gaiellales bacterium]
MIAEERLRTRQLLLVCAVAVLAMGLWFSASSVVPQLSDEWHLSDAGATWLTTSVQLGFVAGALTAAILNLPDRFPLTRLIGASALLGAAANEAVAVFAHGLALAIPLRFLTGFALAGVYPPGIKLMATWFRAGRGFAVGALVGALALGSGTPHLVNAAPSLDWQAVLSVASVLAVVGAGLAVTTLREGPYSAAAAPFHPGYVRRLFTDRAQRLVCFGYFGHMWELYAMWTWVPAYAAASFAAAGDGDPSKTAVELAAFATIGLAGLAGCILGGLVADVRGRAAVTIGAMAVSCACCVAAAALYGLAPAVIVALMLVWGMAVVADSAQFSTALTEVADAEYVGTAVTAQTAIGFAITVISIRLLSSVRDAVGWRYAFLFLAVGPALGIVAMARVRSLLRG